MNQIWVSSLVPKLTCNGFYDGTPLYWFDRSNSSYSCMHSGHWFQLEFPSKIRPFSIKIQSSHATDGWNSNGPKFYVEASNNSDDWVRILTVNENPGIGGTGKVAVLTFDDHSPVYFIKYTNNGVSVCMAEFDIQIILEEDIRCETKQYFGFHLSIIFSFMIL